MRPRFRARHELVMHRIVMDIIKMARKVNFIANHMIPEALLPKFHTAVDAD